MRAVLDELPAEQCQVIELAYFGGFTHTEIAEMLETPIGTVKGRMRLGLEKMRGQLGRQGVMQGARMSTNGHARFEDDAGAYLLGALHDDELQAFEAPPRGCERCREEVASLRVAGRRAAAGRRRRWTRRRELKDRIMGVVESEARAAAGRGRASADRARRGRGRRRRGVAAGCRARRSRRGGGRWPLAVGVVAGVR